MKKLLFALSLLASALASHAGAPAFRADKKAVVPISEDLFRAREMQIDLFGQNDNGHVDRRDVTFTKKEVYEGNITVPPPVVGPPPVQTVHVRRVVTERFVRPVYTHNAWGGGVDLNYFFTRNFGCSLEGSWVDGDSAIHSAAASLICRFPFESPSHKFGIAPYIFAGGGGQFDGVSTGFGHAGGGFELRFCRHFGIFLDSRYVFNGGDINFAQSRSGVRLIF